MTTESAQKRDERFVGIIVMCACVRKLTESFLSFVRQTWNLKKNGMPWFETKFKVIIQQAYIPFSNASVCCDNLLQRQLIEGATVRSGSPLLPMQSLFFDKVFLSSLTSSGISVRRNVHPWWIVSDRPSIYVLQRTVRRVRAELADKDNRVRSEPLPSRSTESRRHSSYGTHKEPEKNIGRIRRMWRMPSTSWSSVHCM